MMTGHVSAQVQHLRITTFGQGGPMEKAASIKLASLYKKLGVQVEFVNFPGNRALKESNEGRFDGELLRKEGIDREYQNLIQIKTPLASTTTAVFARDKSINVNKGWVSLRDYVFSFELGTKIIEQNTVGFSRSMPEYDIKDAFRHMLNKHVDLVVMDERAGLQLIKEMGMEASVYMLSPPLSRTDLYHYLHKKHADLAVKIDAELRKQD
jgi:polar amino acid transport system substrate-binding protein